MNRKRTILINVLTIVAVMTFVVVYAINDWRDNIALRTEAFDNTTVALEHVMSNFLLGEQRICNNWSHYVNARHMTMDEAIDYVRLLKPSEGTAHIVYLDDGTYSGRSTAAPEGNPNLNSVSYAHIDVLETLSKAEPTNNSVNLTRSYTNPIDGVQSVAFCHPVTLRDPDTGRDRQAVLMRVVPVSVLDLEWVFMAEQYSGAEVALTDERGNWIFKGSSFSTSGFPDFVKSLSVVNGSSDDVLRQFSQLESGHVFLEAPDRSVLLLSFSPLDSTEDRVIVTSIPRSALSESFSGRSLVAIVGLGLLLVVAVSLGTQNRYRKRLENVEGEATKAVKVKNEFLAAMSRDFRTPLNTLMGVTALANSRLDDKEVISDCLRKIGLHGNYLNSMLNDVLDVFQIESGEFRLSPAPFSIVDSASTMVNMSQAMLREKNIDFSFHIDQLECENFYADQVRINQVLINILSNALKDCNPGGRVHVSLGERLGSSPATTTLVCSVSDTGAGMEPDMLNELMNPFAEADDDSENADAKATVLSLAITQRIVQQMGGHIEIDSAPDRGTTVTVVLELPRVRKAGAQERTLPSVRVLIVDENADLRQTAKETLQSLGAVVGTSPSGMDAVAHMKQMRAEGEDYDVIILGRRMHDMDGVQTARKLHEELEAPLPKILISAYDWTDLRENAREAGVDGFISKPLFRSTLYKKISAVMGLELSDAQEDNADLVGMHVLVAEDNDINWTLVEALLEPYGITCERAENGQKALDRMTKAREGEISMIFMDLRMPVMNGLEATRAIRRLTTTCASVPIIAMTSENRVQDVQACLEAGMNGHVAKPIDTAHILQEIRKVREDKLSQGAGRKEG